MALERVSFSGGVMELDGGSGAAGFETDAPKEGAFVVNEW
jgi:hypothetical protein